MIVPYVGIFMLAKMSGSEAAGIYGLALSLTYIFPILIDSLRTVLLPEVSRFRQLQQFETYLSKSLRISLFAGIAVIPLLFFSRKIILLLFGPRYAACTEIFNLLLLSYIASMINNIIQTALHSMKRPHIVAIANLAKLTLIILGSYLLIPRVGVIAPAILSLAGNIFTLGLLSAYIFRLIHRVKTALQDKDFPGFSAYD
jgi:O-antigen/teichoic acid export membrane protein